MRKGRYVNEINLSRHDRSYLSLREPVTDVTAAIVFYIEVSTARQRKTRKRWIILDILKGHITVP